MGTPSGDGRPPKRPDLLPYDEYEALREEPGEDGAHRHGQGHAPR